MHAINQHIKTYVLWHIRMVQYTEVLHTMRTMLDLYDYEICITSYILISWLLFVLNDRWFFQTKNIMQDYDYEICVSLCKLFN